MSYEAMARSHVKELLRTAFGWEQVVVDEDGDVPITCGTAVVYVSVVGRGQLVRVWSQAVWGVRATKAVLQEVNDANVRAVVARVYAAHEAVFVEGHLPVEGVRAIDLEQLCREVGDLTDHLGQLLAAVHGGTTARPAAAGVGSDEP